MEREIERAGEEVMDSKKEKSHREKVVERGPW